MCGNIASGVKVECCEANFCNIQVNVGTLDSTRVINSSNIKTIPYFSIFPNILISILIESTGSSENSNDETCA